MGVFFIQSFLSIAIFLISQPLFFEFFRGSDPNDWITLTLLISGILLATLSGVAVFFVAYKDSGKKTWDIIGVSLLFTVGIFLIIGYSAIFFDGIWSYPWWQILHIAINAPNWFWVIWCIVFSFFCAVFANVYKIEQQVIIV